MLKRLIILTVLVFLTGCAHQHRPLITTQSTTTSKQPPKGIKQRQVRALSAFTGIDVQGQISVNLHTGYHKREIILSGDSRDLLQVRTTIKRHRLYVSIGKGYPQFGPVRADIRGYELGYFRYQGGGLIRGDHIQSRGMDLYISNAGNTHLAGDIVLNKLRTTNSGLIQIHGIRSPHLDADIKGKSRVELQGVTYIGKLSLDGKAWLSLYWIRGVSLKVICKKQSTLQLAGVVEQLDVELWDKARFKGRFLRAKRAFVKTHGRSMAEITALHHQSTLSTDASDIYFYQVPKKTRADFMAMSGSTLNMQEWYQYDEHPITRYNKQFP